jgi:hypothetical protein
MNKGFNNNFFMIHFPLPFKGLYATIRQLTDTKTPNDTKIKHCELMWLLFFLFLPQRH